MRQGRRPAVPAPATTGATVAARAYKALKIIATRIAGPADQVSARSPVRSAGLAYVPAARPTAVPRPPIEKSQPIGCRGYRETMSAPTADPATVPAVTNGKPPEKVSAVSNGP